MSSHCVPRLIGWSGSPSTCTTCAVTFLALSPSVWMITPQLTEQYGHVERVSVVRAILSSLACARTGWASNPRRSAAALPVPTLKNSRLDKPIEVASCQANHVLSLNVCCRRRDVGSSPSKLPNMLEPEAPNVQHYLKQGPVAAPDCPGRDPQWLRGQQK